LPDGQDLIAARRGTAFFFVPYAGKINTLKIECGNKTEMGIKTNILLKF